MAKVKTKKGNLLVIETGVEDYKNLVVVSDIFWLFKVYKNMKV